MNTLENKIQEDLVQAMKDHKEHTVSALRSVKTAIMEVKTAPGGKKELEDGDIIKMIQNLVKQRKESMGIYSQAGRSELADNEQQEMLALMNYLPKMLTESEVEEIVANAITNLDATTMKDMGKVMGFINKTYSGQVDGSMVSRIVKSKLG